jgi:RNA polymerase sigma factor (sigma-70 family)
VSGDAAVTASKWSESEAVVRARLGEAEALAALYHRHGQQLFGLAWWLTGSHADAEDVVQDLFVGLPEALRRYEERGRLEAWLRAVVVRLVLMRKRAERRRREVVLLPDDVRSAPPRVGCSTAPTSTPRSARSRTRCARCSCSGHSSRRRARSGEAHGRCAPPSERRKGPHSLAVHPEGRATQVRLSTRPF